MTVGELIAALAEHPAEWNVCASSAHLGYLSVESVWAQASDAIEPPIGTDPMTEATGSVVCIEIA